MAERPASRADFAPIAARAAADWTKPPPDGMLGRSAGR